MDLAKPPGSRCRMSQSGSLLAARTPEHAALVEEEAEAAAGWGVELEKIDAEGVHRLAPYLTGRGIRSAYFVPGDIYIEEPRSLLEAYMTAIAQLGSLVIGETPVTGIRVDDGEIAGVTTPRGDIATPLVIDAAGAWAREVGALAGVDVPIAPVRHQLLITRPIAGMSSHEPIARIVDASAYLRPARGGLMMGGMESDPMPIDPRLDPDFTIADTPLDMRVLDGFTEALGPLVPALGDTPVAEHRAGLFTMTPDARFLAGPIARSARTLDGNRLQRQWLLELGWNRPGAGGVDRRRRATVRPLVARSRTIWPRTICRRRSHFCRSLALRELLHPAAGRLTFLDALRRGFARASCETHWRYVTKTQDSRRGRWPVQLCRCLVLWRRTLPSSKVGPSTPQLQETIGRNSMYSPGPNRPSRETIAAMPCVLIPLGS